MAYKGPNNVPNRSFSLVRSAAMPGVLQADAGAVTAQPPAAIPSGSTPSTALEKQVFNIVVVPN